MGRKILEGIPSEKMIEILLDAHGVSFWVKRSIEELSRRDVVDVLHDLELLQALFERRFEEIISQHKEQTDEG